MRERNAAFARSLESRFALLAERLGTVSDLVSILEALAARLLALEQSRMVSDPIMIQGLRVEPGDVVVVAFPKFLDFKHVQTVGRELRRHLGPGIGIVAVPEALSLEVLRPGAVPASAEAIPILNQSLLNQYIPPPPLPTTSMVDADLRRTDVVGPSLADAPKVTA